MTAMIVVATNKIQVIALKATPAFALTQTGPLQNPKCDMKTASARKPASQNSMVTASAARIACLCARLG